MLSGTHCYVFVVLSQAPSEPAFYRDSINKCIVSASNLPVTGTNCSNFCKVLSPFYVTRDLASLASGPFKPSPARVSPAQLMVTISSICGCFRTLAFPVSSKPLSEDIISKWRPLPSIFTGATDSQTSVLVHRGCQCHDLRLSPFSSMSVALMHVFFIFTHVYIFFHWI